ncbi:hypothetical protein HED60_06660 [Planctomycetales bacterium ZRK34]|nr:hypothetical protein HED60_06660 [Planctomycetales bacterium ZRK34]
MTLTTHRAARPIGQALRPTTTEKVMPRLLRSAVESMLEEAATATDHHDQPIDIVMDGQIVFSHARHLQRA